MPVLSLSAVHFTPGCRRHDRTVIKRGAAGPTNNKAETSALLLPARQTNAAHAQVEL